MSYSQTPHCLILGTFKLSSNRLSGSTSDAAAVAPLRPLSFPPLAAELQQTKIHYLLAKPDSECRPDELTSLLRCSFSSVIAWRGDELRSSCVQPPRAP